MRTDYRVKVVKLENGNGYFYTIGGTMPQPNIDIGEYEENRIGFKTKEDARTAGKNTASGLKSWIDIQGW